MKKHLIILLFLLASLASHAQSDAYLRFAPNPNLDVAFVEAFRLDDTTTVDITVILAKDSATFVWLCEEFNLAENYNKGMADAKHMNPRYIMTQSVSKNDPTQIVSERVEGEYDLATISLYYRKINIYHIMKKQQLKSVFAHLIHKISKKKEQ